MKEIIINEDFITLTQLLKMTDIISSGGMAKYYLQENKVFVNDVLESRRGRKLFSNDQIKVEGTTYIIKETSSNG